MGGGRDDENHPNLGGEAEGGEGDERDAASLTGYNGGAREQQRLLLETMITA